jgi:lipoate-protein ligase B
MPRHGFARPDTLAGTENFLLHADPTAPFAPYGAPMTGASALAPLVEASDSGVSRFRPAALFLFHTPIPYAAAWTLQSRLHQERVLGTRPDSVLILEHRPVYTLGRSARPCDWDGDVDTLRAHGAELHHVNRGGSITYHGPGQLVLYPILKVAEYAAGPRQLVWLLEEALIRLLTHWNIDGRRLPKKPGVWIMSRLPAKIASIGIRIEQGISLHGCSINVDMDLDAFKSIRPCGIPDCRMTTMAHLNKTGLSIQVIKHDMARIFSEVFGITWTTAVETSDDHPTPDRLVPSGVPHV